MSDQSAKNMLSQMHGNTLHEKCVWKADINFDDTVYDTECGHAFVFYDGGPAENEYIYCPSCGRMIDDKTEFPIGGNDV